MTVELEPGTHRERDDRSKRTRKTPSLNRENTRLVLRLAHALADLEHAADPRTSTPIAGQMRVRRPSSEKDEGQSTRWARTLQAKIHSRLSPLLNEFDNRVEGSYEPPPKREMVRCVNRKCRLVNKRQPKYFADTGIEVTYCGKCNGKLSEAP